jgi:hypothetical protein
MTEPDVTGTIEVRVAIRRDIVASSEPEALSRDTGIPVEVLLTSFDTWDDGTAEIFADYVLDDGNYFGLSVGDWSTIEKYGIKEKQE